MITQQFKIRLSPDELKELNELADRLGIKGTALALIFIKAGMEAVGQNGGKVLLPLHFKIFDPSNKK